jgi:peptide deformylase
VDRHAPDAIREEGLTSELSLRNSAFPMVRPILRYGEHTLHKPAAPVADVDDDVRRLVDDMIATMYAAPGVGLAATQLGVPLRVFVVDVSVGRNPADLLVMINPVFLERDGMQLEEEGCLSLPGFNATVVRPSRAVIKALDRSGTEYTVEGQDLLARAFQHEMDHLDGMVFVDRLRGIKKDMILRKIYKLKRAGRW